MLEGYAIIIDSGSSGSRAQIYRYSISSSGTISLPEISQVSTYKTTPGLSTFSKSTQDLWSHHFEPLINHAKSVIPVELHSSTPIYVQATAGMRLLEPIDRARILRETCRILQYNSEFVVDPCENNVEVIDGDTEGLYGWLALNYLTDKLGENQVPYGFLDMGGASTQLAFVPSSPSQLEKHEEDMYTVSLKTNTGELKQWPVFVSSWLGFGANEARRRQLHALVSALPEGINYDVDGDGKEDLVDPCSPVGMKTEVEYNGKFYTVTGSGEYEGCLKTIYPLLLNHLPCKDEPCLFNGVHAPGIDYTVERFVGVSEYWYTANDVFNLGGEYNYEVFEEATKHFCGEDWDTVLNRFKQGGYGTQIDLDLLKASCFKASWIVNVLHEGFGMPRLGIDKNEEAKGEPIFKSVKDINGNELTWTLGKMVLYASSQNEGPGNVGIQRGSAIQKSVDDRTWSDDWQDDMETNVGSWVITIGFFLFLFCSLYFLIIVKFGGLKKFIRKVEGRCYNEWESDEELINLEEGRSLSHQPSFDNTDSTLRTRSAVSLQDFSANEVVPQNNLKHSITFTSFGDHYSTDRRKNTNKLGKAVFNIGKSDSHLKSSSP